MTITPCARCKQPGILHTVAGEGAWDAERGEFRASYVAPAFPEACPADWYLTDSGHDHGYCTSGACATPDEAVSEWDGAQSK